MKVLLMGFSKIKYMPYINFYLDNIDKTANEVHILYWNRDMQSEDLEKYHGCIFHEFGLYQEDDVSKISKLGSFAKYRRYVKKLIKQEQFDFIFVLHSLPGVLIVDILKRKYSGKYIFDYRDSTYERFSPYKKVIEIITRNSCATFVSSDAFRRFLPENCKEKIYTSHNLLEDSLKYRDEKALHGTTSNKIRIAFWGFVRNEQINKEIIRKISKDERFELHYYGREQQTVFNLKKYSVEINSKNVFFHGEYKPEDRYEFVKHTDIIHNIYEDDNMMLAMGNKYYDGIIFRIPQICLTESFMGECAEKAGVGFFVDPYEDFTDKILDYYKNLDRARFYVSCDKELERVKEEYKSGIQVIQNSMLRMKNNGEN